MAVGFSGKSPLSSLTEEQWGLCRSKRQTSVIVSLIKNSSFGLLRLSGCFYSKKSGTAEVYGFCLFVETRAFLLLPVISAVSRRQLTYIIITIFKEEESL